MDSMRSDGATDIGMDAVMAVKILVAIVDVTVVKREGKALEAAKSEAERANAGGVWTRPRPGQRSIATLPR